MSHKRSRSSPGLRTNNYYQVLSTNNTNDITKRARISSETNQKPPPIVITGKLETLESAFKTLCSSKFFIKNISIGTKVFLTTFDDYEKCINELKSNNIEFFTYNRRDVKLFKSILCGLPEMETKDISDELKSKYNLNVEQISAIKSKFNNSNNTLYFVSFQSKEVSIRNLNQIKSINNIIVKWKKYIPKKKGPTQCHSCGMYGHGSSFCNRKKVCIICSNQHSMDQCPYNNTEQVDSIVFRCHNCSKQKLPCNHRADDINCPCRNNYLIFTNKSKQPSSNNLRNDRTFPTFPREKVNVSKRADQFPGKSYADQLKSNNATSNDLFSMEELFQIFSKAVIQLKNCSSKLDQIQVITSLLQHGV